MEVANCPARMEQRDPTERHRGSPWAASQRVAKSSGTRRKSLVPETVSATKTATASEIFGQSPARNLLQDIFADLHPALLQETRDLASIFTPESAADFLSQLTNFEQLLSETDTYEVTLQKLQAQIDSAEGVRDQLLAQ